MSYWKKVDPVGAIADFRTVYRQAGKNHWRFAALAAAVTFSIFSVMAQEEYRIEPRKPTVVYINSWEEGRSDEEIIASNIANQRYQDILRAEQAKREEQAREIYRTLGRMSGMDVEAIERKAAADKAAEAAAKTPVTAAGSSPGGSPPAASLDQLARP
jgi:hypothetical protein